MVSVVNTPVAEIAPVEAHPPELIAEVGSAAVPLTMVWVVPKQLVSALFLQPTKPVKISPYSCTSPTGTLNGAVCNPKCRTPPTPEVEKLVALTAPLTVSDTAFKFPLPSSVALGSQMASCPIAD